MNKKAYAALLGVSNAILFCTCPINATEAKYTLTYNNEESLITVLEHSFSQDLKGLEFTKTKGDTYYFESDDYTIKVNGLDLESVEEQSFEASIFSKGVNEILVDMGFPTHSIDSVDIEADVVDNNAPKIKVKKEYTVSLDETIDFDKQIKVVDDKDTDIKYTIDGDIDYSKEGSYKITVEAKDESGNLASKEVVVNVEDSNFYEKIAQAALDQIGVGQDCTMLVTNSLKAVGINFHGAPEEYISLGEWTNNPVPGDICIYYGHVAIYIGNGQAVHGGWAGGTTAIYSVDCSNSFMGYIHVTK